MQRRMKTWLKLAGALIAWGVVVSAIGDAIGGTAQTVAMVVALAPLAVLVAWARLWPWYRALRTAAGGELLGSELESDDGPFVAQRARLALRPAGLGWARRATALLALLVVLGIAAAGTALAAHNVRMGGGTLVEAVVVRTQDPDWSRADAERAWRASGNDAPLPETIDAPEPSPLDSVENATVAAQVEGRTRLLQEQYPETPRLGERVTLRLVGDDHMEAGSIRFNIAIYAVATLVALVVAALLLPPALGRRLVFVRPEGRRKPR